jgi:hypothetical protein
MPFAKAHIGKAGLLKGLADARALKGAKPGN